MAGTVNTSSDSGRDEGAPRAPCVAIGVSSLSRDSLKDLFRALPVDLGAAYLVAVRPEDELSAPALVELIAAATPMPVKLAENGDRLEGDRIYVGDAPRPMTVEHGRLHVSAAEGLQSMDGAPGRRVRGLGRADSELAILLEPTQIATLLLDEDLRLRTFTPAAAEVFELSEADIGRPAAQLTPRVACPELQADARKVLESLGQVEREVSDLGQRRQFLVRALPCRGVDAFTAGVAVTFLEITGTARAEAALRSSERRFSEAQQLAGIGVWEWDLDKDETWWSPVVYQLWNVAQGETPPPLQERPIHPEDRAAYQEALAKARETGELIVEWRVALPDGSIRWLASTGRMQRSDGGRRMLGVTQDVTARKQTETRLNLLLRELQHRVRNVLGLVRSIISRTIRSAASMEELASHLEGRLDTLARTQSVFTRSGDVAIDLEEMVREEMLAVAAREEQVSVDGPSVRLRRQAAETFALALHELTTNAVKYGALARPEGRVSVRWRVVEARTGPRLSLQWQESGVPAIDTRPARSGFGRELIEHGLPYELGAATSLDFARGGARARIELPLTDKIAIVDPHKEGSGR